MSYNPHGNFGALSNTDLLEYDDTGAVLTGFDFNPRMIKVEKSGHIAAAGGAPAQYRQIIQVQTFVVALDLEAKLEVVPSATGNYEGLAAAAPGDVITFANFASGATVHGFTCDSSKLLLLGEIKQSRSPEKPTEITAPGSYYPRIATPA
jgi:hypothetical protein